MDITACHIDKSTLGHWQNQSRLLLHHYKL